MKTGGRELGSGRCLSASNQVLNSSFKTGYWMAGLTGTLFGLVLACSPCYSQAVPGERPATEVSPTGEDMFSRVIANQKRLDADMNIYERLERTEIRRTDRKNVV